MQIIIYSGQGLAVELGKYSWLTKATTSQEAPTSISGEQFTGGGLKSDVAIIKDGAGNNNIEINGHSIINGAVDMGAGDNTLSISNDT